MFHLFPFVHLFHLFQPMNGFWQASSQRQAYTISSAVIRLAPREHPGQHFTDFCPVLHLTEQSRARCPRDHAPANGAERSD